MSEASIYRELAERTGGACMLGVVGPVRTGKSTFIKRFMECLVIPRIENEYARQRARDELPQSGSGRSIMTAEPKFVPEEPVSISLGEESSLSVRMVDCVGYMVEGAIGQTEDGVERLVTTPWFDHEVPMSQAAEEGTAKVITEHSTLGIVVTTDGSICELPRSAYEEPEGRVIRELQALGKPFVVLLNCVEPTSEQAVSLAQELSARYGVGVLPINATQVQEEELVEILRRALLEFPFRELDFRLPEWLRALPASDPLKQKLCAAILTAGEGLRRQGDRALLAERLSACEEISGLRLLREDLGQGSALLELELPRSLYFERLSRESGLTLENDGELLRALGELAHAKREYDRLRDALEQVERCGYGVVLPSREELRLEEPQIVRQGGRYSVKLRASAPAIHMLRTEIQSEVSPAIGGDGASDEILGFLLQGFDGDVNRLWDSKIFGRSLNELAEESVTSRVRAIPDNAKQRLRETLERLSNEESSGLICILL
jgi:stage IV sporulation protein A